MTLEYRTDSTNTKHVTMTHCPFCNREFDGSGLERPAHIRLCEQADDAREVKL